MDQSAQMQDYWKRHEENYLNFRRDYMRRHPPPKKKKTVSGGPSGLTILFAVIAGAATLLAAFRTGPVFVEVAELSVSPTIAIIEGFLAMLVIDIGVVVFRYAGIYLKYKDRPFDARITGWVRAGGWLALGSQLVAQVYATRGVAVALSSWESALQILIVFTAAISAMLIAFITGEILAVIRLQHEAKEQNQDSGHEKALSDWEQAIDEAWEATKHRYVGKPPSQRKRTVERGDRVESALPETVSSAVSSDGNKRKRVETYFQENPDAFQVGNRPLAKELGVSHTFIRNVKKELSSNGN